MKTITIICKEEYRIGIMKSIEMFFHKTFNFNFATSYPEFCIKKSDYYIIFEKLLDNDFRNLCMSICIAKNYKYDICYVSSDGVLYYIYNFINPTCNIKFNQFVSILKGAIKV